jgi:hypothetical protein
MYPQDTRIVFKDKAEIKFKVKTKVKVKAEVKATE